MQVDAAGTILIPEFKWAEDNETAPSPSPLEKPGRISGDLCVSECSESGIHAIQGDGYNVKRDLANGPLPHTCNLFPAAHNV